MREAFLADQLEVMIDVKARPERVLRLLNSIKVTNKNDELIGAFCSHSEGSYMLDGVIDNLIDFLLESLKTSANIKKDTEDSMRVLFWLGIMRGSLQDILRLCKLMDASEH
jgi:hypothetical protein